jgi:hypothetical protein
VEEAAAQEEEVARGRWRGSRPRSRRRGWAGHGQANEMTASRNSLPLLREQELPSSFLPLPILRAMPTSRGMTTGAAPQPQHLPLYSIPPSPCEPVTMSSWLHEQPPLKI